MPRYLCETSRFDTLLTADLHLSEVAPENLAGHSVVLKVTFDALFSHLYLDIKPGFPLLLQNESPQKVFLVISASLVSMS